jgi:hypothetical protein
MFLYRGIQNRYQSKSGRNQYEHSKKHGFETEILLNNLSEQKAFDWNHIFSTK